MSTYYDRSQIERYTGMLSDKLIGTGYQTVFGKRADDGSFAPIEEGEGTFYLMDEAGTVLPYGYT